MPGNLPRLWDQIESGSRQGRHVQRLADMANIIWSGAVLVDENASTGEIQHSNAAQNS